MGTFHRDDGNFDQEIVPQNIGPNYVKSEKLRFEQRSDIKLEYFAPEIQALCDAIFVEVYVHGNEKAQPAQESLEFLTKSCDTKIDSDSDGSKKSPS